MRTILKAALGVAAVTSAFAASTASAVTLNVGEAVAISGGSPYAFYVPLDVVIAPAEAPFNLNSLDATFNFTPNIPGSTIKLVNVTFNPFPPASFSILPTPSNGSFLTSSLFVTASSANAATLGSGSTELARINLELQPGASPAVYDITVTNPEISYNNGNDFLTPDTLPGSITVVPEPAAFGIVAAAGLGLMRRRRASLA
jgi:MYXO-CTERM domain-containing protein